VAVSGAHWSADFAEHLEHGDLATQLALAISSEIGPRTRCTTL
jgi:hypothetical protein